MKANIIIKIMKAKIIIKMTKLKRIQSNKDKNSIKNLYIIYISFQILIH